MKINEAHLFKAQEILALMKQVHDAEKMAIAATNEAEATLRNCYELMAKVSKNREDYVTEFTTADAITKKVNEMMYEATELMDKALKLNAETEETNDEVLKLMSEANKRSKEAIKLKEKVKEKESIARNNLDKEYNNWLRKTHGKDDNYELKKNVNDLRLVHDKKKLEASKRWKEFNKLQMKFFKILLDLVW